VRSASKYGARPVVIFLLLASAAAIPLPASPAPPLILAEVYEKGIDLREYRVSEKYDGVRALWDGDRLLSRNGHEIASPEWFTEGFPAIALDGELWMGRGTFEALSAAVRGMKPVESEWRGVRYMAFDLPDSRTTFDERLETLESIVAKADSPYLRSVPQTRVLDEAMLARMLEEVTAKGGEGLMLHRGDSYYTAGRSSDLLKLKPYLDDEGIVIAHLPGSGKFEGMMGALLLEWRDRRIRVGTGFTDAQRRDPPPVGSTITFKYHGLTGNGNPRHAAFLRVRENP